ncbi:MAG: metallophosphoesterase family protein [Armatimonadota bacterium]
MKLVDILAMRIASIAFLILIFITGCGGGGGNSAEHSGDQYTFAVFGDNRPDDPGDPQPKVFTEILKSIRARNTIFAVACGDSINSMSDVMFRAVYDEYANMIKSLYDAKVYQVIGNHDIEGSSTRQNFFKEKNGGLFYSFDYRNSHLTVLDSEIIGQEARITGDQLDWLKDDLRKSSGADHRFVFIHRPMYPADGHTGRCIDMYPAERDTLHRLFTDNKIDIVFTGHEHIFYDRKKDGVRYIITGGAGSLLYKSVDGTGSYHHYVLIHINGDKISLEVVKIDE